jgi:FMN-dependent NADH-azoreductase
MKKVIYVEASPRKARSHSIKAAQSYLNDLKLSNPEIEIKKIDLWDYDLPEFNGDMLNAKYSVLHGGEPSGDEIAAWVEVRALFDEFADADHYVFAIPMWNFNIPYKMKHYIDVISQPGMAWGYTEEDGYFGLMQGRTAKVFFASGDGYSEGSGFEAFDFQKPYIELWLNFIGFEQIERVIAQRTLFEPDAPLS